MSEQPQFWTTPQGILPDDDASVIEQNFETAPEEHKPYLAAKLNEYKNFRAHFPKPISDVEQEARSADFRTLHGLATDWEKTVKSLPEERRQAIAFEGEADPTPYRQRAWNQAYLDHVTREQSTGPEDYEARRKAFADANFGGLGGDDDATFNARAQHQIKDQYDENMLLGELGAQATKAAMAGKPYHTALASWQKGAMGNPAYKGDRASNYAAAGEEAYNEGLKKIAIYNDTVDEVLRVMREQTGIEGVKESDLDNSEVMRLADKFVAQGMTRDQRDWILTAASVRAEEMGMDPKGFFKQFGESVIRGSEGVALGGAGGFGRATMETIQQTLYGAGEAMQSIGLDGPGQAAVNYGNQLEGQIARLDMGEALRRWGDEEIDPIKPHLKGWMGKLESGAYGIGSTLPSLLSIAGPGLIIQAFSMGNDTYMELREKYPEMSEGEAQAVALPAGAIMGALDRVEALIAFGGLGKGTLTKAFKEKMLGSYIKTVGVAAGAEFVTETAQNFVPLAVQELESKFFEAIPDPEFWQEAGTLLKKSPETLIAIFPLAMLAGGTGVSIDKKAARALMMSKDGMKLAGIAPDKIDLISGLATEGKVDDAMAELRTAWTGRDKSVSMAESVAGVAVEYRKQAEVQAKAASAVGVTMKKTDAGWLVRDGEGKEVLHSDFAAAETQMMDIAAKSAVSMDEPLLQALAGFSEGAVEGEEFIIDGKRRTAAMDYVEALGSGDLDRAQDILNRVEIAKAAIGPEAAHLDADAFYIHGTNETVVDLKTQMVTYSSRVLRGAKVIDLIEEKSEGDVKRWITEKKTSIPRIAELVQQVEKFTGRTYMHGFDPAAPMSDASQMAVIEGYSALTRAYATGVTAGGEARGQSRVTRALGSSLANDQKTAMAELRNAETRGIGGAVLKAAKDTWNFFKGSIEGALKTAAAIDENTDFDEIRAMLQKSIGLTPEAQMARDVEKTTVEEAKAGGGTEAPPDPPPTPPPGADPNLPNVTNVTILPDGTWIAGPTTMSLGTNPDHQSAVDGLSAYAKREKIPVKKFKAGKSALKSAVNQARKAALPAWQQLISGRGGPDIKRQMDAGLPVSSLMSQFIQGTIPSFEPRGAVIESPADVHQLMMAIRSPIFESIKVLLIDEDDTVVGGEIVSVGSLNEGMVDQRVIGSALQRMAKAHTGPGIKGFIVSHNHPSGNPMPSQADIEVTNKIAEIGAANGAPLLDHVITNGERYWSFSESGMLPSADAQFGMPAPQGATGEYKGSRFRPKGEPLADWETVPRSHKIAGQRPYELRPILQSLRTSDPESAHVIVLDTKLNVTAVGRVDAMADDIMHQVARLMANEGGFRYALSMPEQMDFREVIRINREAREYSRRTGNQIVDIFTANSGSGNFRSFEAQSTFSMTLRHGGGVDLDKFSTAFVGEGNGNAVYGWGIYFAEEPEVARDYQRTVAMTTGLMSVNGQTMTAREALDLWPGPKARLVDAWNNWAREGLANNSKLKPADQEAKARRYANEKLAWQLVQQAGVMKMPGWNFHDGFAYQVELAADPEELLDWDVPINQQSSLIKEGLHRLAQQEDLAPIDFNLTGGGVYHDLQMIFGSPKEASLALLRAGIPGSIHAVPALARPRRDGTVEPGKRNVVVFDDGLINITRKAEGRVSWSMATADNFVLEPLEEQPLIEGEKCWIHPPTTFAIYWHGSGAVFDRFLTRYINSGEGAQVYGWGLYFAEKLGVAKTYRKNLAIQGGFALVNGAPMQIAEMWQMLAGMTPEQAGSNDDFNARLQAYLEERAEINERKGASWAYNTRKLNRLHLDLLDRAMKTAGMTFEHYQGSLYKVDIPFEPEELIPWDFPIASAPAAVGEKFEKFLESLPDDLKMEFFIELGLEYATPEDHEYWVSNAMGMTYEATHHILERHWEPKQISEELLKAGLPGIAYLDGDSRHDASDYESMAEARKPGVSPKTRVRIEQAQAEIVRQNLELDYLQALRDGDVNKIRASIDAAAEHYGWKYDAEADVYRRKYPMTPTNWENFDQVNVRPADLALQNPYYGSAQATNHSSRVLLQPLMTRFMPRAVEVTKPASLTFRQIDQITNLTIGYLDELKSKVDWLASLRNDAATSNVVLFDENMVKLLQRKTHGLPTLTMSLKAVDQDLTDVMYQKKHGNIHTGNFFGGKIRQIAHKYLRMMDGVQDIPLHTAVAKADPERYVEEASERVLTVLERAREAFPDFVSWYDNRIKQAIKIAQSIDPDLKKKDDLAIFKVALAVTSNGNAVGAQTEYAYEVYKHWRAGKPLHTYKGKLGARGGEIRGGLKHVDNIIEKIGFKAAIAFLDQMGTVSEVRAKLVAVGFTPTQAAKMTNGELVDEIVPYAFVFGPKLGSFYNNLNGNFDTVTMDRWFARTINRLLKTQLLKIPTARLRGYKSRFTGAWQIAKKEHPKHPLVVLLKKEKGNLDAMAKALNKWSGDKDNRDTLSTVEQVEGEDGEMTEVVGEKIPALDELRLAGNMWYKFGDGYDLRDAPGTGWERRLIRLACRRAIDKFNKTHPKSKFTPAEFQAVLWYYEKAVAESHGSKQKEESPDYAAGANELHRKLKGTDSPFYEPSEAMMPPYARTGWNPAKAKPKSSTARGNATYSLTREDPPVKFRAVQKGYLSDASDEIGPILEYWQINLPGTYFHGSDMTLPVGTTQDEAMAKVLEKYAANPEAQATLTPAHLQSFTSFALKSADYIDRIADRFLNPQLAPKQRVELFAEIRDRLHGLARSIRLNESLDIAITMDGLRKQASARRKATLVNWRSSGMTYREAQQKARAEADEWFHQQVMKMPLREKEQAGEAVYRAMLALENMLQPFPPEVRAKIGGMMGIAQQKTQKARAKFLNDRATKAIEVTEEWLRKEFRQDIMDLFDRARPTGGTGERRKGKAGAYVHRWLQRAEEYSLMDLGQIESQIARWEKVIAEAQAGDVPDEVMDELNSRWGADIVVDVASVIDAANEELQLAGALGSALWSPPAPDPKTGTPAEWAAYRTAQKAGPTASELATGFEMASDAYENGRLDWLAELARRREEAQADRDTHLLPALGGEATPGEVVAGGAMTPGKNVEATRREQFSFEQGVGDIFDDENVRDWADTWERDAALAEKEALDERTGELRQALHQILATNSIIELNKRLAALAIPEDLDLPGLKKASQLELASLIMRYAEEGGPEWLEEHSFGEKWQEQAQQKLKPETRAIMEWVARQYDRQWNRINEVYSREKGVDLPKVTGYAGSRTSERGSENKVLAVDGASMEGSMSSGFTKTRVRKPQGPPRVENILQKYVQSMTAVEHYRAWARPMREMRQRLGHRDVMMAIEARKGRKARAQVNDWLNIFDQGGVRQANSQSMFGALTRRLLTAQSDAALAFNIGTRLKQMPAAFQALGDLRFGEFLRSGARVATGRSAMSPLEMLQSDIMDQRRDDWRDAAMRMQVQAGRDGRKSTLTNAIRNSFQWAFANLGAFDAAFTSVGASIAYDAAYLEAKALPEPERRRAAEARASQVVSRTAQPNRPGTKSLWENQAGVYGRIFFRFQSANRQILANELYALAPKNVKKDPERALRILILAHVVIPTMVQTMANILKHLMSDKEAEEIWEIEDYFLAWIMGPLSGAILVGPFLEMLAQKLTGGGYAPRTASVPGIDIVQRSLREWSDSTTTDEDFQMALQLAGQVAGGDFTALSAVEQLYRQAKGIKKAVDKKLEEEQK
jgi:DNA repair protein RadC